MLATSLKDKEVLGPAGKEFGKVVDGIIDESTWRMVSLDVELDGNVAKEFHVKKTFGSTTVPIPTSMVGTVGDKIMLRVSTDEVRKSVVATQQ